jgi:multimeric flavodoxin WrbA
LEEPDIIEEGKTALLDAIAEAGTDATMRRVAKELRPQQLCMACAEVHRNLRQILNEYVSGTIPQFS